MNVVWVYEELIKLLWGVELAAGSWIHRKYIQLFCLDIYRYVDLSPCFNLTWHKINDLRFDVALEVKDLQLNSWRDDLNVCIKFSFPYKYEIVKMLTLVSVGMTREFGVLPGARTHIGNGIVLIG